MKYSPDELQTMARTVLAAESDGDERAFMLWMVMSAATSMHPEDVRSRVVQLAQ